MCSLRMRPGHHQERRRGFLSVLALVLVAAACSSGGDGGTPVLKFYVFKEPGGAFAEAAARCTEAAGGRYRIEMADLPPSADQQREQLVRRLAARDSDIDIMGMDVIWTAEFAGAGWLLPWQEEEAARVREGAIPATVRTGTYEGRLWAAPYTTNTQLLWYRKDRVPQPPLTWDEMVTQAERLGPAQGKIQVQGNRYEGLTVWFVSLLASAGGQVLDGPDRVALPVGPTTRALDVMRLVATSPVADPGLSNAQEDDARLGFEAGESAFMVNYTFVWPSANENAPQVAANMGWARWPRVDPGQPSHVTIGGINLGIGAYSDHPELAFEAATCIRSPENQVIAAEKGGLPPTTEALYDDPRVREAFPFADTLRDTLLDATERPATPAYNDVSLAIQRTLHPPRSIQPEKDERQLRSRISRALNSGGLL